MAPEGTYTAYMPTCLNCAVYSWPQVKVPAPFATSYIREDSPSPLLRCGRCKMAHYCSKDCQLEHWVKVHKAKCLYIGPYIQGERDRKLVNSFHQKLSCPACLEAEEVGDMVRNKADPHWGCHLEGGADFWSSPTITFRGRDGELYDAPLAMELGELGGTFTSRIEHTVSLLQRILHKMELTGHTLAKREKFEELGHELFCMRHDFLSKALNIPAGPLVQHYLAAKMMNSGAQKEMLGIIRALGTGYSDSTKDRLRPWDTFVLLFDYFLDVLKDMKKGFEDIEGEVAGAEATALVGEVETSLAVQDKWDRVAAALAPGLAPYYTVLEIVLGGRDKNCSACSKAVRVEATFGDHPRNHAKERRPVAVVQGFLPKFHCGQARCREEVVARHGIDQITLVQTFHGPLQAHAKFRCDWCKTPRKKVHRCRRCLTKVYCSQDCLARDWDLVHSKVCRDPPDQRKVKDKHRA